MVTPRRIVVAAALQYLLGLRSRSPTDKALPEINHQVNSGKTEVIASRSVTYIEPRLFSMVVRRVTPRPTSWQNDSRPIPISNLRIFSLVP